MKRKKTKAMFLIWIFVLSIVHTGLVFGDISPETPEKDQEIAELLDSAHYQKGFLVQNMVKDVNGDDFHETGTFLLGGLNMPLKREEYEKRINELNAEKLSLVLTLLGTDEDKLRALKDDPTEQAIQKREDFAVAVANAEFLEADPYFENYIPPGLKDANKINEMKKLKFIKFPEARYVIDPTTGKRKFDETQIIAKYGGLRNSEESKKFFIPGTGRVQGWVTLVDGELVRGDLEVIDTRGAVQMPYKTSLKFFTDAAFKHGGEGETALQIYPGVAISGLLKGDSVFFEKKELSARQKAIYGEGMERYVVKLARPGVKRCSQEVPSAGKEKDIGERCKREGKKYGGKVVGLDQDYHKDIGASEKIYEAIDSIKEYNDDKLWLEGPTEGRVQILHVPVTLWCSNPGLPQPITIAMGDEFHIIVQKNPQGKGCNNIDYIVNKEGINVVVYYENALLRTKRKCVDPNDKHFEISYTAGFPGIDRLIAQKSKKVLIKSGYADLVCEDGAILCQEYGDELSDDFGGKCFNDVKDYAFPQAAWFLLHFKVWFEGKVEEYGGAFVFSKMVSTTNGLHFILNNFERMKSIKMYEDEADKTFKQSFVEQISGKTWIPGEISPKLGADNIIIFEIKTKSEAELKYDLALANFISSWGGLDIESQKECLQAATDIKGRSMLEKIFGKKKSVGKTTCKSEEVLAALSKKSWRSLKKLNKRVNGKLSLQYFRHRGESDDFKLQDQQYFKEYEKNVQDLVFGEYNAKSSDEYAKNFYDEEIPEEADKVDINIHKLGVGLRNDLYTQLTDDKSIAKLTPDKGEKVKFECDSGSTCYAIMTKDGEFIGFFGVRNDGGTDYFFSGKEKNTDKNIKLDIKSGEFKLEDNRKRNIDNRVITDVQIEVLKQTTITRCKTAEDINQLNKCDKGKVMLFAGPLGKLMGPLTAKQKEERKLDAMPPKFTEDFSWKSLLFMAPVLAVIAFIIAKMAQKKKDKSD